MRRREAGNVLFRTYSIGDIFFAYHDFYLDGVLFLSHKCRQTRLTMVQNPQVTTPLDSVSMTMHPVYSTV